MLLELRQAQNLPVTNTTIKTVKEIKSEIAKTLKIIRLAENALLDFSEDDMEMFANETDLDLLHIGNTLTKVAKALESKF